MPTAKKKVTKKKATKKKGKKAAPKKWGRPSKYDKKYDEEVVEHLSKGFTIASFARTIKVDVTTIYAWEDKHKSFSQALGLGRAMLKAYWENYAIKIAQGNYEYRTDVYGEVLTKNDGKTPILKTPNMKLLMIILANCTDLVTNIDSKEDKKDNTFTLNYNMGETEK